MKKLIFIAACVLLSFTVLAQNHQTKATQTITLRLMRPSVVSFSEPALPTEKSKPDLAQGNTPNRYNTSREMRSSNDNGYYPATFPIPERGNKKEKSNTVIMLTYSRE